MIEYDVKNTPIVDLVNAIILFAVKNRASDIHLDPREDHLLVRIRIDGLLKDHTKIPKEYERNFVTRVKLISAMNITENRLPQDGSIKAKIGNYSLDMRVSSMPTNEGEKIVIRILDYTKSLEGMENLGFSEKNFTKIKKMMAVPNGIILVTGATGTGKSTTVYTMIQELNKEDTNIITVEDPIEMNIEGINQVQANSEIGLDFATVLRSILRQDPNIILIGEIRDSETAKIAVRASITGHLVLSTVHTNNSLSTIERLLDMDVERYLLSTALVGIVSQKLARKLCPHCKNTRITTHYEKHLFKKVLNKDVDEICTPGRCDKCINGYYERTAIQEVLLIDEHIRDIISRDNVDKEELRNLIYNSGVTTLLQDGLEKVADGITSFDEVVKLIQIEEGLDDDYKFDLINKIKINKEEEEKGLANN
ncbi:MAG: GspE/PulE family protein [Bacilli bacterium]